VNICRRKNLHIDLEINVLLKKFIVPYHQEKEEKRLLISKEFFKQIAVDLLFEKDF